MRESCIILKVTKISAFSIIDKTFKQRKGDNYLEEKEEG